jgi:zinc/manganese transport system substrate-binding protein/manganese/iron transport system substrate-binding protein
MSLFLWTAVRLSIIFATLAAFVGVAAGCDSDDGSSSAEVRIVTSLEIFADMARNVAGERGDVRALLPSGSDPHTFELAPGRARDIAQADVVFINGLELEHTIEDVVMNNATGPVIELTEGLPVIAGDEHEEDEHEGEEGHAHEEGNPHMWLDAARAASYVERIREALIDVDPGGRATYESNADAYLAELDALDREFAAAIDEVPAANRKLVTFHDAYPYLAARYGLEVVAVVVPSPGQEPSARDVADLVETLRSAGVPAAFKEPQFNADILDQAAGEANVRVLDLLSDAYNDDVGSYVELMRYNLRQLQEGLGGR